MKLCLVLALVAAAAADQRPYAPPAAPAVRAAVEKATPRILEESNENRGPAGFAFRFVSDDGIERQEGGDANEVTGQYSYTSPEGVPIVVKYVADTLGFRAEGEAIPQPVPTEYPTPDVPSTEPPIVRVAAEPIYYQ